MENSIEVSPRTRAHVGGTSPCTWGDFSTEARYSVHPTISFFVRENSIQNKTRKDVFYNFFNGGSLGRAGTGRERNLQTHYGLHGKNGN